HDAKDESLGWHSTTRDGSHIIALCSALQVAPEPVIAGVLLHEYAHAANPPRFGRRVHGREFWLLCRRLSGPFGVHPPLDPPASRYWPTDEIRDRLRWNSP